MLSDWFYKKLYQWAAWAALILLAGLVCLYGNFEIKDLDLWLHLASGRYILHTWSIPHTDVLSCTMAGHPWINHEWLFQVLIASVYRAFGAEGWITLRLIVLSLIFIHLFVIGFDKEKPLWPVLLLVLVFLNFQLRLLLRPEIFSMLFFVMFIYVLTFRLEKRSSIFSLAFLQVLWVNTHGFFIFGVLLVGLIALGEYLKRHLPMPRQWKHVGRLTDAEFRNIQYIFWSVCAACLVNPNFVYGALYPLKIFFSIGSHSSIFFKEIVELQKPITWHTLFAWQPYPYYRWLIILPAAAFILNRKHLDIGALVLWLIFLILSLGAVRNVPFYAIIAYFVTLINLNQMKWEHVLPVTVHSKRFLHAVSFFLLVGVVIWLLRMVNAAQWRGYYDFDHMQRKSEYGGISENNFSRKAADFLVHNRIRGNFFNDFNSGAYLLGRTYPNIHVFIDGRTEVYGPAFFELYRKAWKGDKKLLDKILAEYHITGAFLNSIYQAPPEKLARYFYNRPDWHLVYFDHDAMIFLKDTPKQKEIIRTKEIQLKDWHPPKINFYALGSLKLNPYRQVLRAQMLMDLHFWKQAREELTIAHIIGPGYADVYRLLGEIDTKQHRYSQAYIQLRKAVVLDSHNDKARFYFAKALYYLGYPEQAHRQMAHVLADYPDNYKAVFFYALTGAKDKPFKEVWPAFQKAAELGKEDFWEFVKEEPFNPLLKNQILATLHEKHMD